MSSGMDCPHSLHLCALTLTRGLSLQGQRGGEHGGRLGVGPNRTAQAPLPDPEAMHVSWSTAAFSFPGDNTVM